MYSSQCQGYPIGQLLTNKMGLYSPHARTISMASLPGAWIRDQKQCRLYLRIMETLAINKDNLKAQQPQQQSVSQASKQKVKRYLFVDGNTGKQPPIDDGQVQATDALGPLKMQEVARVIVSHCDQESMTKNVHKVLYLVFKYLHYRANAKYSSGQTDLEPDLLGILSDASLLFRQELQAPPLANPASVAQQKTSIKSKASRLQGMLQTPTPPHTNIPKSQLEKQNPYAYLMGYLERNEPEKLITNLEYLISSINAEMDESGDGELEKSRDSLIAKLESVIGLVLRRLYATQWMKDNQSSQHVSSFLRNNKKLHQQPPDIGDFQPGQWTAGNSLTKKAAAQLQEKHNKLVLVLKYIISILLGNQTIIAAYAENNIYLYLLLTMLYGEPDNQEEGPTHKTAGSQGILQSGFVFEDCGKKAQKFLETKLGYQAKEKGQCLQLSPTHRYLLQLFSLPLDSSKARSDPASYLVYHSFFQNSIHYFTGYEFYAYLIAALMFGMGMVNKEIYFLDEQYEDNIVLAELLATTTSELKPVEAERRDQWAETANRNWSEDSDQDIMEQVKGTAKISNHQGIFKNDKNEDKDGKVKKNGSSQVQARQTQLPILSSKLLLSSVSFYKNIIYKEKVKKQEQLKSKIDEQLITKTRKKAQELQNTVMVRLTYGRLPLHQVIENLLSSCLPYQKVTQYEFIDWLNGLSSYTCQLGVEQYLIEYLRNLIMINVGNMCNLIDKYDLELMAIQLKTYVMSAPILYSSCSEAQLHERLPHDDSYTFNFFNSGYLTLCTLGQPFQYQLLDKVRELTGIPSQLKKLSGLVAKEFYAFFQIYFQLENITKRGKYELESDESVDLQQKQIGGKAGLRKTRTVRKSNVSKLRDMVGRMDKLEAILCQNNLHGCGEVLRVAWQVLQDYQLVKMQAIKEVSHLKQEEQLLQKMGDKLVVVVDELRHYVTIMEHERFTTAQLIKFREMIL